MEIINIIGVKKQNVKIKLHTVVLNRVSLREGLLEEDEMNT